MKTNLQLILIVTILLLIQGCKPQNAVAPPASDEVISITFESTGSWVNTKLISTRDSIWYYNDGRIIPIDTAIADTQEFIPLVSSFDVSTFWSLEDNIEKRASDQPLFTITVTARQASPTNAIATIIEKKLQFVDFINYPSLQNLDIRLDTLNRKLRERLL